MFERKVISMTKADKGHYSKKNSSDFMADPEIIKAIQKYSSEGGIPCAAAFRISKENNVSPKEVGQTIDSLDTRITHCQLGLYGYGEGLSPLKTSSDIPEELKQAINGSLKDGRLPCKAAWDIAESMGIGKMKVSSACESMKIKISKCQIGAF